MSRLKKLPIGVLATLFLVVSASMMLFALLAPADGASITSFVIWIAGAVVLIGTELAVGVELVKRYFGGGGSGPGEDRDEQPPDTRWG